VVLGAERPALLPEAPPTWPLTSGERRVVNLALRGFSNARIAEDLYLSVNTVEWHLRGAYEKLGVRSKTGILSKLFAELAPPELFETEPAAPSEEMMIRRR
jgi:DNA-binding CsgD family transcriptional regulator